MSAATQVEKTDFMSMPVDLGQRLLALVPEDSQEWVELRTAVFNWKERRQTSVRVPPHHMDGTDDPERNFYARGWNACLGQIESLNTQPNTCTVQGAEGEPGVFLHVHELLENGGGTWLGCSSEEIVRKVLDEETGTEVIALIRLSDHREHVAPLVAEIAALRFELEVEKSIRAGAMLKEDLAKLESLQVVGHGVFLIEHGQNTPYFSGEGPKALKFGHDYAKSLLNMPGSGMTKVSDIEPLVCLSEVSRLVAAIRAGQKGECADGIERDALRWRALLACGRIRALGSAGLTKDVDTYGHPYGNSAHLGLELWTVHPAGTEPMAIEWLNKFADKAVAVMQSKESAEAHD